MDDFDPLKSDAPLIVYIDYKSPYAYIAKDPTYQLGEQLGVEIDWRPLTLDIPSYLGSAKLAQDGKTVEQNNRSEEQWTSVKYAYREARRYAGMRGHTLRGTVKIWDTSFASIGMMWAKRQGQAILKNYTDQVYEPFWKRELDAEDQVVIESVLKSAGAELEGFNDFLHGEGRVEHDEMQKKIFDAGIFGVPSYVVDGELFFGREHLPMIRWLLTDKRGSPPDIAYQHFDGSDVA
ncbi:MAG: DsbA family protein [Pseudomonadota bacterium]